MKSFSKTIVRFTIATIIVMSLFSVAYAAPDYTVLVPLPEAGISGPTKLGDYIPKAFNLSIGIAAALAFVMITLGGITYATSDAISGKSQGREWVTNAIIGLLLVIGAWVILNTINPQISHFDLSLQRINIGTPTGTVSIGGIPMTQTQIDESNAIAKSLGQTPNPCAQGQTTNCVNFNGLQPATISGLQNLSNACNKGNSTTPANLCAITITGGTESGHSIGSAHDNGIAVDIRPDRVLNAMISSNSILTPCKVYTYAGGAYMWESKGSTCGGTVPSSNDHWHAQF